ncbi:MAG: DUF6132 family protein [Sedimentibacter sp.]
MGGLTMILKVLGGVVAGGTLGFLYYKVIGCSTGTCPITSNPINSTIYGALMGLMLSVQM